MNFFRYISYRALPPYLTLFAMVFLYIGFYPGAMTWDSLDQLRQARLGEYINWQPPIMSFVWGQLLWINDGPSVMLFLHMSMLYASSVFLYYWGLRKNYKLSFIFCFLPFLPWIINFQFAIWKDVGLAYSWLLATSIAIFYSDRAPPPMMALFSVAILFIYGSLVRSNSLAGAILLLPFIGLCFFKKSIKFFFIVVSLTFFSCVVLPKIVNNLLSAEVRNPASYVMFDDLAGMKVSGASEDESIFETSDITILKKCGFGKEKKVGAAFCMNDKFEDLHNNHFHQLKAVWVSTIKANPLGYFRYRSDAFLSFLGSPERKPYYTNEFRIMEAPYTFESEVKQNSIFAEFVSNCVNYILRDFSFLFKPYFWIFFSLILSFLLRKGSGSMVPFWMLPFSGLLYSLGYFFITPAMDFRYIYWLCVISTVSFMIWLVLFFSKKNT